MVQEEREELDWKEGRKRESGESDACSARGHESAERGVGSKRSLLG